MKHAYLKTLGIAAAFLFAGSASTMAQSPQDPSTGGQLNQCWGQIITQLAKLDTPDGTSGGSLGQHTRATVAANINGGFTSDGNDFGITFNVKDPDGNAGRLGVGNATKIAHFVHPGDGGNGQHAINNGSDADAGFGLSTILNPVTGRFTTEAGGTEPVVDLVCDFP